MLPTIPDKSFFKIGEVAKILDVKPHIVRYWESEFRNIRPSKTRSGQRLFRRKDIELLLIIRTLVHDQRFTVEGARRQLRDLLEAGAQPLDVLAQLVSQAPPTTAPVAAEPPVVDATPASTSEHEAQLRRRLEEAEERLSLLAAENATLRSSLAQVQARAAAVVPNAVVRARWNAVLRTLNG